MTAAHHGRGGRFRDPWTDLPPEPSGPDVLRWSWERFRSDLPPDPDPDRLPRSDPDLAHPRVPADSAELRITWIGHASFLLQLPGVNILTDPVFSDRASPVQWAGPRRLTPPGLRLEDLPPVDAVVLSHDHYDHLDAHTVDRLHERFADVLAWFTPLAYGDWFGRRGVRRVVELDWWGSAELRTDSGHQAVLRALPARHWTRRGLRDTRRRLWASWGIRAGGRSVYFGGDSGYCSAFREVGEREPSFDALLLPIGAYEPRWFMRASHMTPEEAVQACRDLGGGAFFGMHWGTFRLTDEAPLEPPVRARRAWAAVGMPPDELYIPRHGQTVLL